MLYCCVAVLCVAVLCVAVLCGAVLLRFCSSTLFELHHGVDTFSGNPSVVIEGIPLRDRVRYRPLTGCLTPATDPLPESNQWREKGSQSCFRAVVVPNTL